MYPVDLLLLQGGPILRDIASFSSIAPSIRCNQLPREVGEVASLRRGPKASANLGVIKNAAKIIMTYNGLPLRVNSGRRKNVMIGQTCSENESSINLLTFGQHSTSLSS